jgi:hypothetical protein
MPDEKAAEERANVLARAIAGFGLESVRQPEPTTVPDEVWPRLLSRVRAEGLTGLAVESVDSGWLELADDQAAMLLAVHRSAMTWCLLVERKLIGLAEAFDSQGIGFAVLKGASIAHTMYPEPSARSFADLDLLVSTVDYDRACAMLGSLGNERQRPEPRPGFEVRFGKASVHKDPKDGIEVDLHRTLVLGPFGLWIDPEELLLRREPFLLADRKLGRLGDTAMLLNVAIHASLGTRPPKLVPLRDIAQVWAEGDIDWDTLVRWAEAWHLTVVLQHAFAAVGDTLNTPIPTEAACFVGERPSRSEAKLLAGYTSSRRDKGGMTLATIRAIPRARSKAAYAWALAFPDRRFLEARAGAHAKASYLRRWSVPVRWAGSRLASRRGARRDTAVSAGSGQIGKENRA